MKQFWFRNHLRIAGVCLSGFGLTSSFSISLTQIFLGLSLVSFIIDLILFRNTKNKVSLTKEEKKLNEHFTCYKQISIFYYLAAWILLRTIHLALTSDFTKEFIMLKEMWLLLVLPLVIFRIPEKKWFHIFWISTMSGAASTGGYNLFKYFQMDLQLGSYRVGGFFDTMHTLSYTGITGLFFFLSLGGIFWFWQQGHKKLMIFTSIGNILIFFGFFLSQSRGGYIAFAITLLLFSAISMKKKFIFALPIFLFLIGWGYQNIPGISERFVKSKNDFLYNLKVDHHCGTIQDRINFWQTGLEIWSHHPLLGTGNADYSRAYQKNRPKQICGVAAGDSPHLHNDFLNTLALFGAIGFSIFIMFYCLPFFQLVKVTLQRHTNQTNWLLVGAASAIGMMFFLGLSQSHFTDEEVQMVFWLNLGIFFRKYHTDYTQKIENPTS